MLRILYCLIFMSLLSKNFNNRFVFIYIYIYFIYLNCCYNQVWIKISDINMYNYHIVIRLMYNTYLWDMNFSKIKAF